MVVSVSRLLAGFLLVCPLYGQLPIFPLKDVRPGMKGSGKTVFSASRVEPFQFEVLGVLENLGPKESVILARLSGGPLEETGVMQGMSGSPVYLDGRLLGAVALAFPFSKAPIAGIRPIEEMLKVLENPPPTPRLAARLIPPAQATSLLPRPAVFETGESKLMEIATPLTFGGFTRATMDYFAPQLRGLGLEPRQGGAAGGNPAVFGDPSKLEPGSMISVQLLSGDLSVGADGTITCIDGKRVYAFGHRLLAIGGTELPFARADVLTLLPNLSASFKISTAREWMGTITEDRNTAIGGELGRRASLIPLSLTIARHGTAMPPLAYNMQLVEDSVLTPFLLQMAVFSAIDSTERTTGVSSFTLRGEVRFRNGEPPIKLDNMFTGEFNVPAQAALWAATPVSYALQSGFDSLRLKDISLQIESFNEKKQAQIDDVWTSRPIARPGEIVELSVAISGPNGVSTTHKVPYKVPVGAAVGPLYFTVSDGATANLTDFAQLLTTLPKSAAQVLSFLNHLRGNTKAYVRVWRAEPNFFIQGEDFPDPPPSISMLLAKQQTPQPAAATLTSRNSKMAEMAVSAGELVITGNKTIQVEVKE